MIRLTVTVKMAAAFLEPGDVIVMYLGYEECGLAVVTEHQSDGEIGTTAGRYAVGPHDEVTMRAYGAFRELGKQGARIMAWSAILEPTPLMLEETQAGMGRSARAYLLRLKTEEGFAVDNRRRSRIDAVLWHYGKHERRPGSFERKLIETLDQADSENFARLAIGFPDEALCVHLCKNTEGGTAALAECLAHGDALAAGEEHRERRTGDETAGANSTAVLPAPGTKLGSKMLKAVEEAGFELAGHEACASAEPHGEHTWLMDGGIYLCRGAIPYEGRGLVHTPHHGATDKICHPVPDEAEPPGILLSEARPEDFGVS